MPQIPESLRDDPETEQYFVELERIIVEQFGGDQQVAGNLEIGGTLEVCGGPVDVIITDPTTGTQAAVEDNDGQGCLAVCVQDQITEPIDSLFNQSVSNFTLASDTTASTETTLNYTFTATGGHGIIVGDEVLLLDVVGDRVLQAVVITVVTNTITIDRPLDNVYPSATTLGRIVISNMAVVGSLATPQIFTFRAGTDAVDITRLLLTMVHSALGTDDQFGSLPALTNGFVLRIFNGLHKTIFNFKTNGDIKQFCYDVQYATRSGPTNFGTSARISFGGQAKHGVVMRVSDSDVIQWVVQDDLTGLVSLTGSAQGHKVTTAG